ncbi:MAG: hypothetical protein R6W88_10350 [Desulfobacterales bacterium]
MDKKVIQEKVKELLCPTVSIAQDMNDVISGKKRILKASMNPEKVLLGFEAIKKIEEFTIFEE